MKAVLGLRPLWLAVVCGLASSLLPLFAVPAPRPNVLVILTDDQRWDAMSWAGHPLLKTPNMDRLAAEGARFANMFVTTSLCSPSRASVLSVLYAHCHGMLNNFTEHPGNLRRKAAQGHRRPVLEAPAGGKDQGLAQLVPLLLQGGGIINVLPKF